VDVMHCVDHAMDTAVIREMALIKLRVDPVQRTEALQICEHFAGKTVDMTETSMIVMMTCNSEKLDACINMLRKFDLVELVRTGKVVMARGDEET